MFNLPRYIISNFVLLVIFAKTCKGGRGRAFNFWRFTNLKVESFDKVDELLCFVWKATAIVITHCDRMDFSSVPCKVLLYWYNFVRYTFLIMLLFMVTFRHLQSISISHSFLPSLTDSLGYWLTNVTLGISRHFGQKKTKSVS